MRHFGRHAEGIGPASVAYGMVSVLSVNGNLQMTGVSVWDSDETDPVIVRPLSEQGK